MGTETEEKLLKNTVKKERAQVCEAVRKLGSKLSGLLVTCGILVFAFGLYILLVPPDASLSPTLSFVFIGALGFIGGLNIMSGLLLLLGED